MAFNPLSPEYKNFTHYTLRIKRSDLEAIKEVARRESVRANREVTIATLIRFGLKTLYPELFPEETYEGPK